MGWGGLNTPNDNLRQDPLPPRSQARGVAWERGGSGSSLVPRPGEWLGNEARPTAASFPGPGSGLGTRLDPLSPRSQARGVTWERGGSGSSLVPRPGEWLGNEARPTAASFPGPGSGLGTRLDPLPPRSQARGVAWERG